MSSVHYKKTLPVFQFIVLFYLVIACESRTITYYGDSNIQDELPPGITPISLTFSGVKITTGINNNTNVSVAPGGMLLVFQSQTALNNFQIYSMDINGFNLHNISNSQQDDIMPVISPNGLKIAFYRENDVYIMDISGGNQQKISTYSVTTIDPVTFTRDGQYIIATAVDNGEEHISKISVDGSSHTILTPSMGGYCASLANNSDLIVFVSGESEYRNIYTMDYYGSNIVNVTNNYGVYNDPVFTPDDTYIVFSNMCYYVYGFIGIHHIFKIRSNGTMLQQLTYGLTTDFLPVISPDGKWVAFNRRADDYTWDIYFTSINPQYEVNFTSTNDISDLLPVFSPAGDAIYFQSGSEGRFDIFSARLTQLPPVR